MTVSRPDCAPAGPPLTGRVERDDPVRGQTGGDLAGDRGAGRREVDERRDRPTAGQPALAERDDAHELRTRQAREHHRRDVRHRPRAVDDRRTGGACRVGAPGSGSKATSSCPASSSRTAIRPPIVPRPTSPTGDVASELTAVRRRRRPARSAPSRRCGTPRARPARRSTRSPGAGSRGSPRG